jgi:hypothetical protein
MQANVHKNFEGPIHDAYHKHKAGENDKAVWQHCSARENVLIINTAIRLIATHGGGGGGAKGGEASASSRSSSAKGAITVDSIDGRFKQHLNLNWKKC